MTIQDTVRLHRNRWIAQVGFKMPNIERAVAFMVTEAAEALDETLRLDPEFVRNNPRPLDVMALPLEIADTIIMACTVLDLLNLDLEKVVQMKLEIMDKKHGIKEP